MLDTISPIAVKRADMINYKASAYSDGQFSFTYSIDGRDIVINLSHSVRPTIAPEAIERIGFNIGMCYLMDLAEIVLARKVRVYKQLSPGARMYWQQLHEELVIEKCYALQLPTSAKNMMWEFGEASADESLLTFKGSRDRAAVCLTGGKESLAILKTLEDKRPMLLFLLDPEVNFQIQRVYHAVKDKHPSIITTSNREELFVPLQEAHGGLQSGVDMAHLMFNTMLYADQCPYMLIGNEYSSNYPNDVYEGHIVNHQYVKTIRFAEKLNRYVHEHVTKDFAYYSPFFGLYELKIADLFFADERYMEVWTSCNQATAEVNFCSRCYKCAFTYLLARTKKSEEYLARFFSTNMLDNVALFKPMMDPVGTKPLECVGDKAEVWVALEQLHKHGLTNPVVAYYAEHIRPAIEDGLPSHLKRITSVQRIPVSSPKHLQTIFYRALEEQAFNRKPAGF